MEIASRMAFRAKGTTAPNPNVGAIIVKDGKILSEAEKKVVPVKKKVVATKEEKK